MEFYELNRLYDAYLGHVGFSKSIDNYLYKFIPILIGIGCLTSLLNIVVLSRPYFQSTSKSFLLSQVVFNFLFQIVSLVIFISNNYEKYLIDNFYFKNHKTTYFKIKIHLNIAYNVLLYCLIWLFILGALDYCFISILKFHHNANYNRQNRKLFQQQQIQFNYQQKLLHHQQSRLRQNKNNLQVGQAFSATSLNTNLSQSQQNENKEIPSPNKLELSNNFFTSNENCINYSDGYNDDCFIFDASFDDSSKRKKKKVKNDQVSFFSQKLIKCSTVTIIILSFFLAIPQFFGYEVKENFLTLSPSAVPTNPVSEGNDNIYFIQKDILNKRGSKLRKINNYETFVQRNLALGFVLRTNYDKKTNDIIAKMRKTHKKFFTQQGFFNLASKQYQFCSIVKNSLETPTIKTQSKETKDENPNFSYDIITFNISLICIRKSQINKYLAYNTLYFWLEHTMVISAPICIALVVISSLIYTFIHYAKLMIQQKKIKKKRQKMIKIQEQNNMAKFGTLNYSIDSSKMGKKFETEARFNISDDYLNINLSNKAEQMERKLHLIQREDQNLNRMFIIELAMYIFFTFPYTFARLILDLFSKDQTKINLDFFVYYKTVFLLFQLNLICKFFVLFILNVRFRISFARLFSLKPSTCFLGKYEEEFNKNYEIDDSNNSCLFCYSRFCFRKSNEVDDFKINQFKLDENDDLNEHSTDFNSNLHQYNRPADPDIEL